MEKDLFFGISDEAFAFSDLREDFLYHKIPRNRRGYYIAEGLRIGREAAAKYRGQDLMEILCGDGVTVKTIREPSPSELHAQICYDGNTRQIDLFSETAKHLCRALAGTSIEMPQEQVEQMFLAHEFYHWLEYSGGVQTDALCEPVIQKLFGLFPHPVKVHRVCEIAAFIFAKEFCGLPVHPKAMDYILLYRNEGEDLDEIRKGFLRLEQTYQQECL